MCLTNIGCTLDYPLLWTWHFKWCGDAMIGLVILSWLTCVCVSPKIEASSARSGSARYCVRWNLRSSCCICSEEYMVRGFRIFFPLLLTRVSSPFSIDSLISPPASVNTVPSMTYITKSINALWLYFDILLTKTIPSAATFVAIKATLAISKLAWFGLETKIISK